MSSNYIYNINPSAGPWYISTGGGGQGGASGATVTVAGAGGGYYTTYSHSGGTDFGMPNVKVGNNDLNPQGLALDANSDVKLGETSLRAFMESVTERLALLERSPELEEEWQQLRDIANEYRRVEADIRDQLRVFEILKTDDTDSQE